MQSCTQEYVIVGAPNVCWYVAPPTTAVLGAQRTRRWNPAGGRVISTDAAASCALARSVTGAGASERVNVTVAAWPPAPVETLDAASRAFVAESCRVAGTGVPDADRTTTLAVPVPPGSAAFVTVTVTL